jgi:iron complex outermembrane receptor protein
VRDSPLLVTLIAWGALFASTAAAQDPNTRTDPPQPPEPQHVEERVDVVAATPLHGLGVPRLHIPANVQVFTADQLRGSVDGLTSLLTDRAGSVQTSDAQASTFGPDLVFRGFFASPLLGASQGVAVYQDGVRLNDAFGDTIQWDAVPTGAIASVNLLPGSNPLFGLNALGGALSIRTKDGFEFAGHHATVNGGSFGRRTIEAASGGHHRAFAYFISGALTDEAGWRDFSPSTIRRVFGDAAWRGATSAVDVSVTAAANDLTGNGAVPLGLLDSDRRAVFTHPDATSNDTALVTVKAHRAASEHTLTEAVGYYRWTRTGTFNGDAAAVDGSDDPAAAAGFDAINNISRTRTRAAGATGQITRTAPIAGRENHFVAGAGLDAASTQFAFATEWAHLTPDRGTTGSGLFDADARVDLDSRVTTGSAFVTNTASLTRALAVTTSARFNVTALQLRDQIGTALNGDHRFVRVNPAAGLTYQLRSSLNAYGSYTQSSRVPTAVEVTCANPEDPCRLPNAFVSDPPLSQVVGRTWEVGARGNIARLRWSAAAFRTSATDDIIFVGSGTHRGEGHFQNVALTRRSGLETSIEGDLPHAIQVFGAYTVQRAVYGTGLQIASPFHPDAEDGALAVEEGDRLPGVPSTIVKGGVTIRPASGLVIGVNARAQTRLFLRGDEANLLPPVPGFIVSKL